MNCPICAAPTTVGQSHCLSCGASLSTTNQVLPAGTVLQHKYRIDKVLGQGGFGITYAATQLNLSSRVAIKELFPSGTVRQATMLQPPVGFDAATWQQAKRDFTDEARTLAQFNHPDIVRVTDHFEEGGTAYLVMEYLEGETLAQKIEREGRLSSAEVERVARRLLEALGTVHAANLLHRDLKPDNIFLDRIGRVILIDFGSARGFSANHTISHTRLVTPGYAPLEQYGTQGRFGPYTDLYALGATLYHALAGQVPPAATELVQGTPLPALPSSTSAALRSVIERCMAVRITERPQSCAEALRVLSSPPAPAPVPPPAPVPAPPAPAPAPPPARGRSAAGTVWMSVITVLALTGLFFGWQSWRTSSAAAAHADVTPPAQEVPPTPSTPDEGPVPETARAEEGPRTPPAPEPAPTPAPVRPPPSATPEWASAWFVDNLEASYDHPQPAFEVIQAPGRAHVGDVVTLHVKVRNIGTDAIAGSISVSFPKAAPIHPADVNIADQGNIWKTSRIKPGTKILILNGEPNIQRSTDWLIEGYSDEAHGGWMQDDSKSLTLRMRLLRPGHLRLYVRATASTALGVDSANHYNAPSESVEEDQQRFPVIPVDIQVQP